MKLHSCFGEDGQLQVFDVWESQEAFDEFLTYLGPVMEELGFQRVPEMKVGHNVRQAVLRS